MYVHSWLPVQNVLIALNICCYMDHAALARFSASKCTALLQAVSPDAIKQTSMVCMTFLDDEEQMSEK